MEDQNGWKRLNFHVPGRIARAGLDYFPGLGPKDVCESVFDGMHGIGLRKRLVSMTFYARTRGMKK